ncbi:serine/threonine-protein phosphatase alpha-3 isoform-like [Galendromus occidentalis]|uniref:Serine/threonine-protein phosphatase n=1 Tax=Galendromus occidentalis TaxID=34638 RepID=A0AAJ7L3L9_9ACAR|nr:serine/threonine-protein phosphatase alpha-3 isoform-like [Galendromus occidentalis]
MTNEELDLDGILRRLLELRAPQGKLKDFRFTAQECTYVADKARAIFASEPIMADLEPPLTICGDIHGQFRDLLRIIAEDRMPPYRNYLFLGDYVDRGQQSLEVLLFLYVLKIKYPANMFLLRGNHESIRLNSAYGFLSECQARSTTEVFRKFNDSFAYMPLVAIVGRKMFCCHGGIPKGLLNLSQIRKIKRPLTEIADDSIECDLLWADPGKTDGWTENERGVSWCFGEKQLNDFLDKFGFDVLVRGHEVVRNGYEFFGNRRCVTLFSAANYCNEFPNSIGIMHVGKDLLCSFSVLKPHRVPPGPDPFRKPRSKKNL